MLQILHLQHFVKKNIYKVIYENMSTIVGIFFYASSEFLIFKKVLTYNLNGGIVNCASNEPTKLLKIY